MDGAHPPRHHRRQRPWLTNSGKTVQDSLRKELEKARSRCEAVEGENQELTAAVSDATRPLVRQIEELQAQLDEKNNVRESVENSQIERVREAEKAAAEAHHKYEQAETRVTTMRDKCLALEEQMRHIRADRDDLAAALADARTQASEREIQLEKEVERLKTTTVELQHHLERVNATLADERNAQLERVNASDEREEGLRKNLIEQEHTVRELQHALREERSKAAAAAKHRARSPSPARSQEEVQNEEIPDPTDDMVGKDQMRTNLRLYKDKVSGRDTLLLPFPPCTHIHKDKHACTHKSEGTSRRGHNDTALDETF